MALSVNKKFKDLLNIDGIGETQINSIKKFFLNKTNIKVLSKLQMVLKIHDAKKHKNDGPLSQKTFMITGKLKGMSRAEAKSLIEQNSGSMVSTISKKLNYLIVGDKPTKKKN